MRCAQRSGPHPATRGDSLHALAWISLLSWSTRISSIINDYGIQPDGAGRSTVPIYPIVSITGWCKWARYQTPWAIVASTAERAPPSGGPAEAAGRRTGTRNGPASGGASSEGAATRTRTSTTAGSAMSSPVGSTSRSSPVRTLTTPGSGTDVRHRTTC